MSGTLSKFIDPKVSIGAILAMVVQFAFIGAWVLNDHQISQDLHASNATIANELEAIKFGLPVSVRDIENNKHNIVALQSTVDAVQNRIGKDENDIAVNKQIIDDLKYQIETLIETSQGRAPVRYPRSK